MIGRIITILDLMWIIINFLNFVDIKKFKISKIIMVILSFSAAALSVMQAMNHISYSYLLDKYTISYDGQWWLIAAAFSAIGIYTGLTYLFNKKYSIDNLITFHLKSGTYELNKRVESTIIGNEHTNYIKNIIKYNDIFILMPPYFSCTGNEDITILCFKDSNKEGLYYCYAHSRIKDQHKEKKPFLMSLFKWTAIISAVLLFIIAFIQGPYGLQEIYRNESANLIFDLFLCFIIFGGVSCLIYDAKMNIWNTIMKYISRGIVFMLYLSVILFLIDGSLIDGLMILLKIS